MSSPARVYPAIAGKCLQAVLTSWAAAPCSFCRAPGHSAKHDAFLCQSTELLQREQCWAPWQQQHIHPLRARWAQMDGQTDRPASVLEPSLPSVRGLCSAGRRRAAPERLMLGGGSLGAAVTLHAVFTESFCNQNPSWVVQVAGDGGYEGGTAAPALSAPEGEGGEKGWWPVILTASSCGPSSGINAGTH